MLIEREKFGIHVFLSSLSQRLGPRFYVHLFTIGILLNLRCRCTGLRLGAHKRLWQSRREFLQTQRNGKYFFRENE